MKPLTLILLLTLVLVSGCNEEPTYPPATSWTSVYCPGCCNDCKPDCELVARVNNVNNIVGFICVYNGSNATGIEICRNTTNYCSTFVDGIGEWNVKQKREG